MTGFTLGSVGFEQRRTQMRMLNGLGGGVMFCAAVAMSACGAGQDGSDSAHEAGAEHEHEHGPNDADTDAFNAIEIDGTLTDSAGRILSSGSERVVRANRAAETSLKMLARIETSDHHLIEFYEPRDGFVLLSGNSPQRESAPEAEDAKKRPYAEMKSYLQTLETISAETLRAAWQKLSGDAPIPP